MTRRTQYVALTCVALVAFSAVLVGCETKPPSGEAEATSTLETTAGPKQADAGKAAGTTESVSEIPAGRAIPEGGGGPDSYTFREEWRRALAKAKEWRPGAYLVTASGNYVNDDGVPSSWQMTFVDAIPADKLLRVEIDPWGAVTTTKEIDTTKVKDLLQPGDARIPFGIMDSDAAVAAAKKALGASYELGKTENPAIRLQFDRDDSGPWWIYVVEDENGKLIITRVHALTGVAKVDLP